MGAAGPLRWKSEEPASRDSHWLVSWTNYEQSSSERVPGPARGEKPETEFRGLRAVRERGKLGGEQGADGVRNVF